MNDKVKIPGTVEEWETGALGRDDAHARRVGPALQSEVDDALGMQMISIRLDKNLIESFKLLASFHGVGYQPLMRDALKRFAECELKSIVSGLVESQRHRQEDAKTTVRKAAPKEAKTVKAVRQSKGQSAKTQHSQREKQAA